MKLNYYNYLLQEVDVDFNPEFIQRLLAKLNWSVICEAITQLDATKDIELPENLTDEVKEDEDMLRKIHHVLLEVEVIEGKLICPETGREFPINKGIPNMLLNDEEV
ncbi:TRMT112 [Bugula neritina]|uniref:Multifunctional methyltransferase subunit TRM112-like protein n=1 Tax=Bugula neritina TaxID=10212 RepID=A0A7J7JUT0_BUGNE|nr:TRMT112 [Bugula neritina]